VQCRSNGFAKIEAGRADKALRLTWTPAKSKLTFRGCVLHLFGGKLVTRQQRSKDI